MNRIKRGFIGLMAILVTIMVVPLPTLAALYDMSGNIYIDTKKLPSGKTGENMTFSVIFSNDGKNNRNEDLKNVEIGFDQASATQTYEVEDEESKNSDIFPFEITSGIFDMKKLGTVKQGSSKTVSFSARVRRDIPEGYYTVPFEIRVDGATQKSDSINIWISKSTPSTSESDDPGTIQFVLGENQDTPYGTYPKVMEFNLNVKNNSTITAQDVTVIMGLSEDSTKFPFDINDGNYDRKFDRIGGGETVQPFYSMAIRKDVYSGYYPIKFTIQYKDSSDGELQKSEQTFYVHVQNKEKEETTGGDFNANDRTKARIIVESFETNPETIMAGEEFELILRMKNASESVNASNILFSFESEKVSDSAVFTTESGSSSVVVNSLGAGKTTEIRMKMLAKAGVDQRSYSLTINEKFDSPEFKNAEEKVSIDIPVRQTARLNTGTIDVMPTDITVGSESNVMFGINNTGKVLLYNVMAKFEADSIQSTDTYVGNIKPGETGNVDVMLSGVAPTADEGKIKIIITYEDENGVESSAEKEMTLFVNEAMEDMGNMDVGNFEDVTQVEQSFFDKNKIIIISAAAAALVLITVIVIVRKRKKKKAAMEEGMDDEIS